MCNSHNDTDIPTPLMQRFSELLTCDREDPLPSDAPLYELADEPPFFTRYVCHIDYYISKERESNIATLPFEQEDTEPLEDLEELLAEMKGG